MPCFRHRQWLITIAGRSNNLCGTSAYICTLWECFVTTSQVQVEQSNRCVYYVCLSVCLSVCARTITYERNNLWPIYVACWLILTIAGSGLKVSVIGKRSGSHEANNNSLNAGQLDLPDGWFTTFFPLLWTSWIVHNPPHCMRHLVANSRDNHRTEFIPGIFWGIPRPK